MRAGPGDALQVLTSPLQKENLCTTEKFPVAAPLSSLFPLPSPLHTLPPPHKKPIEFASRRPDSPAAHEGAAPLPRPPRTGGREPGEREAPGRPPAQTPSPALLARSPRSPLSCSSACKQMGIFFFHPGMVSAPGACSPARSSSPARSPSPGPAESPRASPLALPGWPRRSRDCSVGLGHRGGSRAHRGGAARPALAANSPAAPGGGGRAGRAGPGRRGCSRGGRGVAGRPGRGRGRVQAERRDCRAPGGWARAEGVGSRCRLCPLLLLLLPLPCLSAASRWDSEPPPPPPSPPPLHKAPRAAGLRLQAPRAPGGGASPETRARRAGTKRARALTPSAPRAAGLQGTELTPSRGCRAHAAPPPKTQTGGSTGSGDDLAEVGGSVSPSSPSSRRSPPARAVAPSPKLRLFSYRFANFALD